MTMRKTLLFIFCALTTFGAAADGQRLLAAARQDQAAGVAATPISDPADSLVRLGRQAITDGDYRLAARLLKQVVDKYPKSDKAAEALYWRAWSLNRLGIDRGNKNDLDDALEAVDRLQKEYAQSASATDGASLRAQIRSAQANLGDSRAAVAITTEAKGLRQARSCASGSNVDEETRMAALEGLMNMNAADAIPILKDVLKQTDPCRIELRKKAVWLLSQKRGSDVATTLLDVARTDPSTDVRGDAVFWLSQTRSELAIPMLDSVLFTGGDEEIRKKAVFSLSQFSKDDRARASLKRAAEDEKMPEEIRSDAIFWLGQQNLADLEFFRTLFRKTRDRDLRGKIVFAVSQTNRPEAAAWLLDLARDKSFDVDVRKDAIFQLSQRRRIDLDQLSTLYDQSKGESEIQDQVLFVFSQRSEPASVDKLMAIAKSDPDVERRKKALFWLGQKNDPRVKQFLRDLIKG
jgi:HEAT repeat protein